MFGGLACLSNGKMFAEVKTAAQLRAETQEEILRLGAQHAKHCHSKEMLPLEGRTMKIKVVLAIITISLIGVGISASPGQATETTIEQMPADLETQFTLSALPPAMRNKATVYLLDPTKGYQLSQQGTSGVTCLVERTAWEQADFRNDIYVPLCYDAEGSKSFLKVIMDAPRFAFKE